MTKSWDEMPVTSPYTAALKADADPEGCGWYLSRGSEIWNVYKFGPEWVLCQSEKGNDPPAWYRWEDLIPVSVLLDGMDIGVSI